VTTLGTFVRVLKEAPLDERTSDELPRLAGTVDQGWETLANAYADVLGMHENTDVQRAIGKRLAKTFEDELADVQKAEETYKYVLSVDPLDVDALTNLDRIYLSLEQWPDLAQTLEQRVKAPAEAHELVDLWARLGEIYETKLIRIPDAIRAYRKIFDELDKTHEGAIAALGRIYELQGAWVELNTVYERELENASGDVAEAEIRAKLAHLAAEKLADPTRAIDTWKVVLDLRGEDPEALRALANLYEGQQQWRDLVEILEREFEIAPGDDDRVNILTRRARVFTDKLSKDELALEDWNRVLDIDYANLAALRSIAAIRRRQQDANELVSALHQIVDRAAQLLDEE
ncbi:MAG: tetratricopeptide repeat protein, partial [Polyangiaceae bacterium]